MSRLWGTGSSSLWEDSDKPQEDEVLQELNAKLDRPPPHGPAHQARRGAMRKPFAAATDSPRQHSAQYAPVTPSLETIGIVPPGHLSPESPGTPASPVSLVSPTDIGGSHDDLEGGAGGRHAHNGSRDCGRARSSSPDWASCASPRSPRDRCSSSSASLSSSSHRAHGGHGAGGGATAAAAAARGGHGYGWHGGKHGGGQHGRLAARLAAPIETWSAAQRRHLLAMAAVCLLLSAYFLLMRGLQDELDFEANPTRRQPRPHPHLRGGHG